MDIFVIALTRVVAPMLLTFWLAARLRAWDAHRTA